jgi:TonB family protein
VNSATDSLSFDTASIEARNPIRTSYKRRPPRFVLAALASLGVHSIILVVFGLFFRFTRVAPQSHDDIPVTIDLPVGGLAGGGGGSAIAVHPAHHLSIHHVVVRAATAVTPRSVHHQQKAAKPIVKDALNTEVPEVKHLSSRIHPEMGLTGKPVASSGGQQGIASNGNGGSGTGLGGGNGSGVGSGTGPGTGPGFGTGGTGPRAIYAPAPTIPDDLRDEVMRTTVVARFEVSHDGTAKVTLLDNTDYSELDDAILDTLRQWRFLPAMKNGVAIDSEAEVRLLITVK